MKKTTTIAKKRGKEESKVTFVTGRDEQHNELWQVLVMADPSEPSGERPQFAPYHKADFPDPSLSLLIDDFHRVKKGELEIWSLQIYSFQRNSNS